MLEISGKWGSRDIRDTRDIKNIHKLSRRWIEHDIIQARRCEGQHLAVTQWLQTRNVVLGHASDAEEDQCRIGIVRQRQAVLGRDEHGRADYGDGHPNMLACWGDFLNPAR